MLGECGAASSTDRSGNVIVRVIYLEAASFVFLKIDYYLNDIFNIFHILLD